MRFLLFGTLMDPRSFAYNLASNPASSKWLKGFVGGLVHGGSKVILCGHCYSQVWPKGKLRPGALEYLDHTIENRLVRFWNLPGLRYPSMGRGYHSEGLTAIQSEEIHAIITYNPYPWHVYAARKLRKKYNIPWVCLNLDFDDVGADWGIFLKNAGDADGHLFLSHWGYENAPVRNKIHLDSGVTSIPASYAAAKPADTINIVYLGKLSKSGGLESLLKLPERIDSQNVRFIYGGKGYPAADQSLRALAQKDSRVEYLGFVEEAQVRDLFERATIFLNPRDPDDVVNDMVFPSKIMEYLRYGKTVVSTWTKGLEPIYRDLLVVSTSPTPEDFAQAVDYAVKESLEQRQQRASRIRSFLENSRLWSKQAQRFVEFSQSVIAYFKP